MSLLCTENSHVCRAVEIGDNFNLKPVFVLLCKLSKHVACDVCICSSQAHNDGHFDIDLAGCLHDTLCYRVALHDATKDIHKDGIDFRVLTKDLKSGAHLLSASTSTNVQEVGRATTLELDDVHSGHGEACAVHHASDVAIERNVVESDSSRFRLIGICVA